MQVWVNPACSKCRTALARLDQAGLDYSVRRYLDDPPDQATLRELLDLLGLQPWELTRTGDPLARELGVARLPREPQRWLDLLAEHPQLLQRPIVVTDDGRAFLARDEQTLEQVLAAGRQRQL